jgi:hypothetical protein
MSWERALVQLLESKGGAAHPRETARVEADTGRGVSSLLQICTTPLQTRYACLMYPFFVLSLSILAVSPPPQSLS